MIEMMKRIKGLEMKISKKAKIDIYYMMFFWAVKETIKGNIYFTNKELFNQIDIANRFLIFKKQKQHKKVKKETVSLLQKIQNLSTNMEFLSFEMVSFIALNFLLNECQEKDMNRYKDIDVIQILEDIRLKYPKELKEHYKFFDEIEDKI